MTTLSAPTAIDRHATAEGRPTPPAGPATPPRHVGYVLKRFPRISETFIAAEVAQLRASGQRVTVFAVSRPVEPFVHDFVRDLDVDVIYLPHRLWRQPARTIAGLARTVGRRPRGLARAVTSVLGAGRPSLARMRRLLQATVLVAEFDRVGVDHQHAHFATSATSLAHLVRLLGGPTYSVTAHAKDIYHRQNDPTRLRARLDGAAFVATVCTANRSHLVDDLGVSSPVHVVPNAVDLARLPTPDRRAPRPGRILAVARLVDKKGLDDLVQAVGVVGTRGHDVTLELVGDGPLRDRLVALAREHDVDLELAGSLPHEQVVERYTTASVFALPCVVADTGDRDGLPTSVLEAMASGVPVVTTAVTGLADLVRDGDTGLVVDQHDHVGLADALERVLVDDRLADRLSVAGRQAVLDRHDLCVTTGQLRSLFATVAR